MSHFKTSGLYMAILVLILFSCKKEKPVVNYLSYVAHYPVAVPECSGLSPYKNGTFLTVSDSLSKVYMISTKGELVDSLPYTGKNLEGVTFNQMSGHFFVVEENTNEVVELDTPGQEIRRFEVDVGNTETKHGLEGICYNPENDHLYLVSEKNPGDLFEFDISGKELSRIKLSFASDYSSVYYEAAQKVLWILSDESGSLSRCNLNGEVQKTWVTGVKKGEGVIVDSQQNKVFIITDNISILYVLSF